MISQQEIIDIICTEAIEHGGLQEVPSHKHGATHSFHSPKCDARGPVEHGGNGVESEDATFVYDLRLVIEPDGRYKWVE